MKLFENKKRIAILSVVFFMLFAGQAYAATLFMNPSQIEVTVGNIVNVQIAVDTSGKVINNAESIVQFPKDLLEVVSVDKTSIFSLWVEEPSYSNNLGQLTFNGGVPNPGYQGSGGKIISITFRAKKAGTASVVFSTSAVRENDGLGTDILKNRNGSSITIVNVVETVQPPKIPTFVLTSSTHPNQNSWYNKGDVELSWVLPKNATAVKTLLGSQKDSEPIVYYDSPISSKSIEDVEDGTWYFHANYLADGVWSKTEHFKLQIDTTSPTDLRVESTKDDSGKVTLKLKAGDSLSGIDRYQVVADSDSPINVKSDANGEAEVEVPFYKSGEHTIVVSVFDKAGNKAETKITVTTDYVLELRVDTYPAKVQVNENIEISGTAPYPNASLRISLRNNDDVVQTYKIKSNSYSKFDFISQPITAKGTYTLWVDMLKDDGEISISSQRIAIVAEIPLLISIGSYTIGLMKVLVPAAILLTVFLFTLIYGVYKFVHLYRRVGKEGRKADNVIEKSFTILRRDVRDHVIKLQKAEYRRKLTLEEIEFLERFEEDLAKAEDMIEKEVRDIYKLK
jgi:hypothetical protein